MALPVKLFDSNTGLFSRVNTEGGVVVGPLKASKAFNATLDTANTEVSIVAPDKNKVFLVTSIVLTGNKAISATVDATVEIFEATEDDLTAIETSILNLPIARSSQFILSNIYLSTHAGRTIVGRTSDDDVFVTILGYYV